MRKKAVLAVESGWRIVEVSDLFGISRQSVGKWVGEYRDKGAGALRSRKRGNEGGEPFSPGQREQEIDAILNRTANEEGLPFSMWTRGAVAALVLKLAGVSPLPDDGGAILVIVLYPLTCKLCCAVPLRPRQRLVMWFFSLNLDKLVIVVIIAKNVKKETDYGNQYIRGQSKGQW